MSSPYNNNNPIFFESSQKKKKTLNKKFIYINYQNSILESYKWNKSIPIENVPWSHYRIQWIKKFDVLEWSFHFLESFVQERWRFMGGWRIVYALEAWEPYFVAKQFGGTAKDLQEKNSCLKSSW